MLFSLLLVLAAALVAAISYLRRYYGQVEKCGVPVIKPTFCFGSGPWKLHEVSFVDADIANFRKYGALWGQYDISTPWLNVADPTIIKKIMVKHFDTFPMHQQYISEQRLRTLDQTNGQEWRDLRKGLSPTFTSSKIKAMLDLMDGGIDQMTDHLKEIIEKDNLVEVKDVYQKVSLDVIARCAFGIESNSFKNPDNKMLTYGRQVFEEFIMVSWATTFLSHIFDSFGPLLTKLVDVVPEHFRHIWKIGSKICAEREAQGPGQGDFVDRLIELKKRHAAGEFPAISSDQITGQSIIFILAGFETTANTLSSLTYNLVKNPEALEKLVAEVEGVLEEFEGRIDQDTIADMPYLEAAIKESLRMFPPIFRTDRVCVQDWHEDGLFIPKDMNINIPVYVVHHDPALWPEPELFQPERFLKENAASIIPYSWLPFGAGPRACIGERFAMVEIKMAMTKLLSKFRIEVDETTTIKFKKGDQSILSYDGVNVRIFNK